MEWMAASGGKENNQDLSWYEWTIAKDISSDGQWVLFEEGSDPTTQNETVAVRRVDGSPPIHLGDGSAEDFSPDGKWVLSVALDGPPKITLLPIGPGQPRVVALPGLERLQFGANFLPDGRRVVVNGQETGHRVRSYIVDLDNGRATPVTPEGVSAVIPSPDGVYLAGMGADRKLTLFPIAGGQPRFIAKLDSGAQTMQWSSDSKAIYMYKLGEVPLNVQRLDLAAGKISPVRQLVPGDRAGVVSIGPVIGSRDGSAFAYSYYQMISVLYEISGLS